MKVMKKELKLIIALLTIIAVIVSGTLGVSVSAEIQDIKNDKTEVFEVADASQEYRDFLSESSQYGYPNETIIVNVKSAIATGGAELQKADNNGREDTIIHFGDDKGIASFNFTVNQAGLYNLELYYRAVAQKNNYAEIEIDIALDGKSAEWLQGVRLKRLWEDVGEITVDKQGNDVAPTQIERTVWTQMTLEDSLDSVDAPLYIYCSAGVHTLSISCVRGTFDLASVTIFNTEEVPSYKEALQTYPSTNSDNSISIVKEAEDYLCKSEIGIIPENDPSNASTSPNNPIVTKLNYISGSKFKKVGSFIEWEIEVPKDGAYCIDMRVRQNYSSGLSSVRKLTIDGKVPFKECESLSFSYDGSWYCKVLGGDNPYLFYLTAGKHILRLTAVRGPLSETVYNSQKLIYRLNDLYSSVVMVVGVNPDRYRDYKLAEEIDGIRETIDGISNSLTEIRDQIIQVSSKNGGNATTVIHSMLNLFSIFKKNPDKLSHKLSTLRENTESLAAWVNNLDEQPLDIDYIRVYTKNANIKSQNIGFFKQTVFELKRLFVTFSKDYAFDGKDKALTVWASVGRDQLKVLKQLIDNDYAKDHDVNIQLTMTSDITSAVLAGAGPDVCLFLDSESPINFAVRNVLTDLQKIEGFDEVTKRFEDKLLTPFCLDGACYAIPLSVSYPMLFVRNDIFEKLNIQVPTTWNELYTIAAVLQRNHLEIGIPSHTGMFLTLLYQNGGELFDKELKTTFNDQTALDSFSLWTSFFSKYSFPLSYDFYNRFRSGQMPIGIADYTLYAQLKAIAPEIRGQWGMYKLPGIADENGNVNSTVCISGATGTTSNLGLIQSISCCVIFKNCDDKDMAFEFINWFTKPDVQAEYGLGIEAELGYTGRYAPADIETIGMLPWSREEQKILLEARENLKILPEYPGNYYIAREVNNACRSVVNDNVNPVDTLSRKNVKINIELERKQKQFDIDGEGASE